MTAKELNVAGPGTCTSLPADLQSLEQVEKLVRELSGREDELHVLVNNAGATWGEDIESFPVSRVLPAACLHWSLDKYRMQRSRRSLR